MGGGGGGGSQQKLKLSGELAEVDRIVYQI